MKRLLSLIFIFISFGAISQVKPGNGIFSKIVAQDTVTLLKTPSVTDTTANKPVTINSAGKLGKGNWNGAGVNPVVTL